MDIFSIGEMVIDFMPGSVPGCYIRHPGGGCANVAISAARNGLDAGFCGMMGNDDFGRFLVRTLKDNKVKVLCPKLTDKAITTLAFVTLNDRGERSFTFVRKPGADTLLSIREIRKKDILDSVIIHGGSCSLSAEPAARATLYALRQGHSLRKLVSFDINYRDLLWDGDRNRAKKLIFKALRFIDLLKISEEETEILGGEQNIPKIMACFNITLIVETLGPKGAKCWFKNDIVSAGCPDVPCIDTTGAGDAFWGTFLSSLIQQGVTVPNDLRKEIISQAIQRGNAAGSICVQHKGAVESLPFGDEIDKFIATSGFQ
ncbi:MAG: carbohydrate kinase [Treponema sp.]|jgi:sugar/nucleoside kinase (ribokinase family)|nr:carbohydrate kinase [Treponema sp.]